MAALGMGRLGGGGGGRGRGTEEVEEEAVEASPRFDAKPSSPIEPQITYSASMRHMSRSLLQYNGNKNQAIHVSSFLDHYFCRIRLLEELMAEMEDIFRLGNISTYIVDR